MSHDDLHTRLGRAAHAPLLWTFESNDVGELEDHASEGCSVCARALVNARETAVDLALAEQPGRAPDGGPTNVLTRTRELLRRRRMTGTRALGPDGAASGPKPQHASRASDPSSVVAHKHLALAADADRIHEIDALDARTPRAGEGTERLLAQVARFLDFSVFFVSIVRGERASYRVQRGLAPELAAFRDLRREMSFCTHCVSAEAPLVVENALVEPFFRGNKAATRFGVAAYVGVPLRTQNRIIIGTLCALHFEPKTIPHGAVELLQVFAERAVAEIERERHPDLLKAVLAYSSENGDVYTSPIFHRLVNAEFNRTGRPPFERGPGSVLVTFNAPSEKSAASVVESHETAGCLAPSSYGILLPNAAPNAARERVAKLVAAGATSVFTASAHDARSGTEWTQRAMQQ
ncbi:MAG: GAF domain-containing protein [Polyangiaceae bacterium]|nr:GAF domain-containing protein [Polyangiaceae bacterium]